MSRTGPVITIRKPGATAGVGPAPVPAPLVPGPGRKTKGRDERKIYGVYMRSVLDTKITLAITEIGKNIKQNLEVKAAGKVSNRCISEGYIKPDSVKILSYSSGMVMAENIEFHVVYECMVCLPVEGMLIECICKTVTKAGIHAQVIDSEGNMPVTVFVARDHHHLDSRFDGVKEGANIVVRVIGIRFELNDSFICAIAKLADAGETGKMSQGRPQPYPSQNKSRPRIVLLDGGDGDGEEDGEEEEDN